MTPRQRKKNRRRQHERNERIRRTANALALVDYWVCLLCQQKIPIYDHAYGASYDGHRSTCNERTRPDEAERALRELMADHLRK